MPGGAGLIWERISKALPNLPPASCPSFQQSQHMAAPSHAEPPKATVHTCARTHADTRTHTPTPPLSPTAALEFCPSEGSLLLHKKQGWGRLERKCSLLSPLGERWGTVLHLPAHRTGEHHRKDRTPQLVLRQGCGAASAEGEVRTARAGPTWRPGGQQPQPRTCPPALSTLTPRTPSLPITEPCLSCLQSPT